MDPAAYSWLAGAAGSLLVPVATACVRRCTGGATPGVVAWLYVLRRWLLASGDRHLPGPTCSGCACSEHLVGCAAAVGRAWCVLLCVCPELRDCTGVAPLG